MPKEQYINTLDISSFSKMLDDTTECYKFYWLEAIVNLLISGQQTMEFNEIIDEMIANGWYSVCEYHLYLGLKNKDGNIMNHLERAIMKLKDRSGIKSNAPKEEIKTAIRENEEIIHHEKMQMSRYVPYHLLSAFMVDVRADNEIWNSQKHLISYIEKINRDIMLPYTIEDARGLKKKIRIHPLWAEMILDNAVTILSWIKLKKVRYLQDRNPGVPGIIYKLEPENEGLRKLKKVRELWLSVMDLRSVRDIYSEHPLKKEDFEVDHFIPWDYIANNELWNLMPMESSLNSSKNNKLPKWDKYFPAFAENQYMLYDLIWSYPQLEKKFRECQKDNIAALWANEELYREGNTITEFRTILDKNMHPIYDAARVQGFGIWEPIA